MKQRFKTKNDNDFRVLFMVDNEISYDEYRIYIEDAKRLIYQASNKKLVLSALVSQVKLKQWDNEVVKLAVREMYHLEDFQAVVAVYAKGKFRLSYSQMNKNDKDFGILINQSFESPPQIYIHTILVHELMHAFFYLLGYKDYTKIVHDTPNTFVDDFETIGTDVKKLYYKEPVKDIIIPDKTFWEKIIDFLVQLFNPPK